MVRFKICCIASGGEARRAIDAGATAIGLVSEMPSGPGVIEETAIAEIARQVPGGIDTFLLTSKRSVVDIVAQQRRCGTNTVQLVDELADGSHQDLRRKMPGVKIVQVIHVTGEDALAKAAHCAPHVDAILLDSGNPFASVKELGGTGRTHDWAVSRRIVEAVKTPVYLAGGLNPCNVGEAVRGVGPWGVDVCSGVRSEGRLDPKKLDAFVAALRTA